MSESRIRTDSLVDLGVEEVKLRAQLKRGHALLECLDHRISSMLVFPGPPRLTLVSVAVPYSSVPQICYFSAPSFDRGIGGTATYIESRHVERSGVSGKDVGRQGRAGQVSGHR
jgi:hypothetical protein